MSKEVPKTIPELYTQFGAARQRVTRWSAPFFVAAAVNLGIGGCTVLAGSKEQQTTYGRLAPLAATLTIGPAVAAGILGSRRARRETQDMAIDIARMEGRMPQDPNVELRRATIVLAIKGTLVENWALPEPKRSPYETSLSRRARYGLHRSGEKIKDSIFTDAERRLNRANFDEQTKQEVRSRAYGLALEHWTKISEDKSQPDYKRKYAYEMRAKFFRAT